MVPGQDAVGGGVEIIAGGEVADLLRPTHFRDPVPVTQGPAAPPDPIPGLQYPHPTARPMQLMGGHQTGDPGAQDQHVPPLTTARGQGLGGNRGPRGVIRQDGPGVAGQGHGRHGQQQAPTGGVNTSWDLGRHVNSNR